MAEEDSHTEPLVGGYCQPGVPCFPFGCDGPVSCNCRCHAVVTPEKEEE